MKSHPAFEFILLSALWGASFLFMRVAAPHFGAFGLMLVRCGVGALTLLPFVMLGRRAPPAPPAPDRPPVAGLGPLLFVGVLNSALPFLCFGYAALYLPAGISAIFNATTPIFGAVVAWLWFGDRLTGARSAGLALGLAGVAAVSLSRLQGSVDGTGLAIAVILLGPVCYAIAASYSRRYLAGADPIRAAGISQIGAFLVLLPPGLWLWPQTPPPLEAWLNAVALGVLSTGLAYLLFFRLIEVIGPARLLTVTFVIPLFAILWGWLFLGETLAPLTIAGGLVVLVGTALATGVVGAKRPAR